MTFNSIAVKFSRSNESFIPGIFREKQIVGNISKFVTSRWLANDDIREILITA